MTGIRVVLAEDYHVVRAAMVAFLAREPDIEVVGEVADASRLIEVIDTLQPDVLVLDAYMPGQPVIQTAEMLRDHYPQVRILILSAYKRREYVVGLMEAGACGYVLKDDPSATLVQAVRAVARGEPWLSPRVMEVLVAAAGGDVKRPAVELTPRETEVLRLMARGYRNEQIAAALTIAEQTVKNYVRSILGKLSVETRVEAVLWAIDQGLVSREE